MKLILDTTAENVQQISEVAAKLLKLFPPGSIILLEAEMGVGKTTLVNEVCKALGILTVSSPTFSIHNRYENTDTSVDHFDLYRIENDEQLESTGFWDLITEKSDFKIIEWPDRVGDYSLIRSDQLYLVNIRRIGAGETRHYKVYSM